MGKLLDDFKAQQEILRMETQMKFPYLLVVEAKDEILRLVNSEENVIYNGEVYEACYFQLTPPEKTQEGFKNAKIVFSTIDSKWIIRIRKNSEKIKIKFVACVEYEDDEKYIEPIDEYEFYLTDVSWEETTIEGTLVFDDKLSINIPIVTLRSDICYGAT